MAHAIPVLLERVLLFTEVDTLESLSASLFFMPSSLIHNVHARKHALYCEVAMDGDLSDLEDMALAERYHLYPESRDDFRLSTDTYQEAIALQQQLKDLMPQALNNNAMGAAQWSVRRRRPKVRFMPFDSENKRDKAS